MTKKKYGVVSSIFIMLGIHLLVSFLVSGMFIFGPAAVFGPMGDIGIIGYEVFCMVILLCFMSWRLSKSPRFSDTFIKVNLIYTGIVFAVFTAAFVIAKGSLTSPLLVVPEILAFPFFPTFIMGSLFSGFFTSIVMIGATLFLHSIFLIIITKKYKWFSVGIVYAVCAACTIVTFLNSPSHKYQSQNHNFSYMNGYSSVDLNDYTPYSESGKLVTLDHKADLWIEDKKEMPVLDGAEACYPVYSAVAKAIYKDIDTIEAEHNRIYTQTGANGEIVTFYNTAVGFERLVHGDVDMFFGAKPSESQLKYAEMYNVELEYTPIGREGFVFFVNEDNPVDNLTSEQIRQIYHGDITNWKEVGGKNKEIVAFQRPERSGSQSMMVYFMGDVELKEPVTFETVDSMIGIIEHVAEYYNEAGALGYSFRYYLEGMNQENGVKMLSVNGVYPSTETISNGEYPITTSLYCITVKGNENKNVQKVIDFLLSDDGQYIIEKTGYCPLK